jgi:diguanylate cyclase (GGDEF)-like protein
VAHVLALPNDRAALVWTDATDRDVVASTMAREALTDNLTNLPNRRSLFARLESEIAKAAESGGTVSYIAVDLDRFKDINESLGHTHGDELLRSVGARLFALLSGIGRLHRLGADEFGVLLVNEQAENVEQTARRILAAMTDPFDIRGYSVLSNLTLGTATFPADAEDAEGLIRRADMALHRAKRGTLGLASYSQDHDRSSARSVSLLGDLRRGIEAGELVPFYQPVLDLTTGRLVAAEALVRWLHPVEGMVMPLEFIEGAEVSGLVGPLTERLASRVASDLEVWRAEGHELSLAINLAPRNVQDRYLAVSMAELLRTHRLPARSLCLEITERTVMHDLATSRMVLADMRDRGFEVAVDDFGTGYSSLAVLRSIPLDEMKLDKTFVDDMAAGDARVVRSMIELGHNLGLRVVAEGVEDVETLDRLRGMGCDRAQGWAIGRPMDTTRFRELLTRIAAAPDDDSWMAARQAATPAQG